MQIYDELIARGLLAQVTDEDEIRDLVNNGKQRSISDSTAPQTV